MKKRQGFVSNSSSSSFIGVIKNDADYNIDPIEWISDKIEALKPLFWCDDPGNDVVNTVRQGIFNMQDIFLLDNGDPEYLEPGKEYLLKISLMQNCLDSITVNFYAMNLRSFK